jgi:hypothetical protein
LKQKDHVEVNRIFGEKSSGKALVIGKPTVGKTILKHFIFYTWDKNKIWTDEFDNLFRVNLKDLNTEREKEYKTVLGNFFNAYKFACF